MFFDWLSSAKNLDVDELVFKWKVASIGDDFCGATLVVVAQTPGVLPFDMRLVMLIQPDFSAAFADVLL